MKTASAVSNSGSKGELTYAPGISVSYLLWDFGVRVQRVRAADFQVQAARFSQNAAFQQIILQVEQVYYQLIGQKASVVVNLESVRQNQVNLAAAVALREQGLAVISKGLSTNETVLITIPPDLIEGNLVQKSSRNSY